MFRRVCTCDVVYCVGILISSYVKFKKHDCNVVAVHWVHVFVENALEVKRLEPSI